MGFMFSVVGVALLVVFGIGMLIGLAKREVNRRTHDAVAPWQSRSSSRSDSKAE